MVLFPKSDRCLSSCVHAQSVSEIPSILHSGSSIPGQSSSIRTNNKSLCLYSVDDCNSHSFEKEGNNSVSISGRLVSKKSESSKGQIDHILGTHYQSRKIGINPCSNICVHRDGIPHSGKHCQNSSRQSSKCSRISELVPEIVISFSQSFPVPSGTTKCYCSVCDTRQIAFTST